MIGGFGCFLGFLALPDRALLGRIHPCCLGTVIGLGKVTTIKRKKNIRPDGFDILSKNFMNSAVICSSDKIPTGKVDEYQRQ
jgi:hypothetical protein